MTNEEFKSEVNKWMDQIGIYNEGCECFHCKDYVLGKIAQAVSDYWETIKWRKPEQIHKT